MTIRTEYREHVTTIVLDRPAARNAIDGSMARALAQAFRDFEANEQARVAVLYGAGGNFCAGADLKAVASGIDLPQVEETGDGPLGPTRMNLTKPVIAAVAGYAVAGGLELALLCDLRVAEEDAVFGVFCRRWGVPLVDGGTIRLPRIVGHGRAMDMILTGRPVAADEALAMGLVNRVVPPGQARAAAEALARQVASFPQLCLRHDRQSACEQWDLPLDRALQNEFRHGRAVLEAPDTLAGAQRFSTGAGRHGRFEDNNY